MGWAKRAIGRGSGNVFHIGEGNPLVGRDLKVTWLREWGKKPAGHQVRGFLLRTFVVNGRTCIGELEIEDRRTKGTKKVSVPWSRNYLDIQVIS